MITTVGHLKEIFSRHSDEDEVFMQVASSENSIYTMSPAKSRIGAIMILHKGEANSRVDIYTNSQEQNAGHKKNKDKWTIAAMRTPCGNLHSLFPWDRYPDDAQVTIEW